ncbi:L-erythro-3,5-diaminohexanoate dehydrogenase [Myxococcus sp. AM011]|uniref:L-erythro-3,5-diaminohexanoate dehydrogenase n=1 Tax=Myxococcus sp. AM011 TaxID=2745200 RepID=UPI001595FC6A|nr:L-erythro-3,5-diaminohexanoate dehydrogenase [Myxococcus sp. AM011]NVJ24749.1 L-erythro-3,5-diaminohexanoate dehydrogenase [Myxococcus sp. AM011]
METMADAYGLSRVVGATGFFPQRAGRLDPSLPCRESELVVEVESLNIDAASFEQIAREAGGDDARISEQVVSIVRERGKMHNPKTGSGGIFIGGVKELGPRHPAHGKLRAGDRIASLVSLTLTPLVIEEIRAVHRDTHRVDVRGHAILFASGSYATLPEDLSDAVALAALDVCGAPALVERHVRPGMTVAVLGAGKGGALCLAQARRGLGDTGRLLAIDLHGGALAELQEHHLCDVALKLDATRAVEVQEHVLRATRGRLCDLVVNCVSVQDTEMATILCARDGGTAIFFSMATSFTSAALGADGVSRDVTLLMGNGYVPGHAELTLGLLRTDAGLRQLFERRYG